MPSRYDTLVPPQKGEFFRFQDGESQVRLVSEPFDIIRHFIQADQRSYACPGADQGCRFCAQGDEPNTKFIYRIIDRADGKLKLAEVGWSVVGAVKELHDSKQYGFDDLPPYDIFVTKTGKGLQTKYAVLPARSDLPLTDSEKEEIASAKDIEEFIAVQNETAQFVDSIASGEQRNKERAEIENKSKKPAREDKKGTTPIDVFNDYKHQIAAASTIKAVDEILNLLVFDKNINEAMDRMLQAQGKNRKNEIQMLDL